MTNHPNAEYLRALADGKPVMVEFIADVDSTYHRVPLLGCSTTVIMSLLSPNGTPQAKHWSFHIEQTEPSP